MLFILNFVNKFIVHVTHNFAYLNCSAFICLRMCKTVIVICRTLFQELIIFCNVTVKTIFDYYENIFICKIPFYHQTNWTWLHDEMKNPIDLFPFVSVNRFNEKSLKEYDLIIHSIQFLNLNIIEAHLFVLSAYANVIFYSRRAWNELCELFLIIMPLRRSLRISRMQVISILF